MSPFLHSGCQTIFMPEVVQDAASDEESPLGHSEDYIGIPIDGVSTVPESVIDIPLKNDEPIDDIILPKYPLLSNMSLPPPIQQPPPIRPSGPITQVLPPLEYLKLVRNQSCYGTLRSLLTIMTGLFFLAVVVSALGFILTGANADPGSGGRLVLVGLGVGPSGFSWLSPLDRPRPS